MQSYVVAGGWMGFAFALNCLGGATVFFFRRATPGKLRQLFLGFAAGIMIAAAIWSLLIPAIETAKAQGLTGWIPVACGFTLGVLFLLSLDHLIPHLHPCTDVREGPFSLSKRTTLLVSAVTLHNIPEGLAVGLSFALAIQSNDPAMFAGAAALALGIGIQNVPEGAAVSLPLRQEGISAASAFALSCLSGAVEPVFGVLAVALAGWIAPIMPWLLAFAAGAMLYVVVEELIPEARLGEHSHTGTMAVMTGFLVMMVLEVALG